MHILLKWVFSWGLLFCLVVFLSNASGVPQGVTGAPTEVNHNSCGTCHTGQENTDVKATFIVRDESNQIVNNYFPGKTYTAALQLEASNNPKSYGFQLTVLEEKSKIDQGSWSQLGEKVKQVNMTILQKQRRYLNQSAPKSDGLFTAVWKAPETDQGDIIFYFAGLAINQNGNTSGDNYTKGQFTLKSTVTSSEDFALIKSTLSPNPATDLVNINNKLAESVEIFDGFGRLHITTYTVTNQIIDVSGLSKGYYFCRLKDQKGSIINTQKLLKL